MQPRQGKEPGAPHGEAERVYHQIREWLMDAVLPPGEFLSEPNLAEQCRASRTPVREACMRLLQDRWLIKYPGKGLLVAPVSVPDIEDLYEYRKMLESFTVAKVISSIGATQLAELRGLIGLERSQDPDLHDLVAANERFHLRLAELAGNVRVLEQLRLTLHFARRLDALYLKVDNSWIFHNEILSALERGDTEAARTAMSDHLDHSRVCLIAMFTGRGI